MTTYGTVQRLAVVLLLWSGSTAFGDNRSAPEFLPPSIVAFAEIPKPLTVFSALWNPTLVQRVESLDQVRAAMEKKQYLDFKAGVAIIESQMGLPWRKIIERATGGGLSVAVDAPTKGVAVLARATDKDFHAKLIEKLAGLASLDAKSKGKADPVKTSDYRGIKVYAIDKGRFAIVEDCLIVTNKEELGKEIVDRFLDKPKKSLASEPQFAKAHGSAGASTIAWAYVNTAAIRNAGIGKKVFDGQAENPAAELVFGGILNALQHTPYVTAALDSRDHHVSLSLAAPYEHKWAKDSREYYFGPEGKGIAPPNLFIEDTILSASSYRDASGMWVRAGDLFNEQTNEELAKADSGLTTLFGGKDFGEDILGAIRPETQVVVARQHFAEGQPTPAIQLPAFGLVAELKNPEKMQPELRRTFQSVIGFFNIVGAMNGQPQFDTDIEKTESAQFVTATYLPDPKAKDSHDVKINYNFSPSIAFAGKRFIVASTKSLAHSLATASAQERSANETARVINSDVELRFDALKNILTDNRGQLVAQNMLKEGHTKEEAERDVSVVLELVGWVDHLGVTLDTTQSELRIALDLAVKPAH
jgi:hypothetical protein